MTRALLVFSFLLSWLVAPAAAQTVSESTGLINGTVTDDTGGVMPGAVVSISSPALMGVRDAVTNANGQYRFVAVPPGDYRMTFALEGFATVVREGIKVGVGAAVTVNVELAVGGIKQEVIVTGQSPVVDVQTTKISNTYGAEQMDLLPNARDYTALMALTPAVKVTTIDVGGSAALNFNTYTTYGTSGQNRSMVEGIIGDEGTTTLFYVDYGSFSEVSIGTAANSAEVPGQGTYSRLIAKSGGNTYRGNVYFDYNRQSWSSRNIDDELLARGVTGSDQLDARDTNRLVMFRDFNIDVGGYVIPDRLWWFGSYRNTENSAGLPQYEFGPRVTKMANYTAKGTFNINPRHSLIAFINDNRKSVPNDPSGNYAVNRFVSIHRTDQSTWNQKFPAGVYKGEYTAVLSDAVFFEVRLGNYFYDWNRKRKSNEPRYEDTSTNQVWGAAATVSNTRGRPQMHTSLSYFKTGWAGSHNFKFGAEWIDEWYQTDQDDFPGDVIHILRNGQPLELWLMETPNTARSGVVSYSAYVTDSWRLGDRWTINPGFRFDRYRNYLPEQTGPTSRFHPEPEHFPAVDNVATFNNFAPRLGISHDLTGAGKTIVKANFGLYLDSPGSTLLLKNPSIWYQRYTWDDLNGDLAYQIGEEATYIASVGGASSVLLDPNLKRGRTREVAGWFEHELMANFGVRTGFVWRYQDRLNLNQNISRPFDAYNVPVTIRDPGPDGIRGTADDGADFAAFNLDPAYLRVPSVTMITSHPKATSDYYTWEIAANKRMSNRWSLLSSFAKTWSRVGVTASNPNQLINTDSPYRQHFAEWSGKLTLTADLPAGLRVTPLLRVQSGTRFGRQVTTRFNYGNETWLAEPRGSRRMDHAVIVDARVEKIFKVGTRRFGMFFDLFNITNSNAVTNMTTGSGASFMRPISILSPRIAKLGLKFGW